MHTHYDDNKIYSPMGMNEFLVFFLLIEYTTVLSTYDYRTYTKGRDYENKIMHIINIQKIRPMKFDTKICSQCIWQFYVVFFF